MVPEQRSPGHPPDQRSPGHPPDHRHLGCHAPSALRCDDPAVLRSVDRALPRLWHRVVLGVLSLVTVVGGLGTAAAVPASSAPSTGASDPGGYVRALGGPFLTDASGRVMILHGVDAVEKRAPYVLYPDPGKPWNFSSADAARIASLGFTVVRLGLEWQGLEPGTAGPNAPSICTPGRPGNPRQLDMATLDAYLAHVHQTVDLLAEHHIYTLLDMHQDIYSRVFGGDGAPPWAVCTNGLPVVHPPGRWSRVYATAALNAAFGNFWTNDVVGNLQGQYDEVWRLVAKSFRNDPWVIGYDLFNEPFARPTSGPVGLDRPVHQLTGAARRSPHPDATTTPGTFPTAARPTTTRRSTSRATAVEPATTRAARRPETGIGARRRGGVAPRRAHSTFDALLECFYTGRGHPGRALGSTTPLHCPPNDPAKGLIPTIEQADPHHLLFVEPDIFTSRGAPSLLGPMDYPNLVLNFHAYCSARSPVTGNPTNLRACAAQVEHTMVLWSARQPGLRSAAQPGGPALFMSEFGATSDPALVGAITATANQLLLGWSYWSWKYYDDPTGSSAEALVTASGRYSTAMPALVQPYAQAIAGTPVSMTYEPSSDRFTLRYIPNPTMHAPSVVFVPPQHYRHGYCASVLGGTVVSPAGASSLDVHATTTGAVTLTVAPGTCSGRPAGRRDRQRPATSSVMSSGVHVAGDRVAASSARGPRRPRSSKQPVRRAPGSSR